MKKMMLLLSVLMFTSSVFATVVCRVEDGEGCAYSDKSELGYCVEKAELTVRDDQMVLVVEREDVFTERALKDIVIPLSWGIQGGQLTLFGEINSNESWVEVSGLSRYFVGDLVLEEDFMFPISCREEI